MADLKMKVGQKTIMRWKNTLKIACKIKTNGSDELPKKLWNAHAEITYINNHSHPGVPEFREFRGVPGTDLPAGRQAYYLVDTEGSHRKNLTD